MAPGADPHPVFLAEHYLAAVDAERVEALLERLIGACRVDVHLLGAAGLPGDECVLSLFAGPSAEAVEETFERAGVPVDRIVPVLWRPAASLG
ncbi:MAG TPA: hypothetical protein VGF23_02730 [Gaiellaceae bacterium]